APNRNTASRIELKLPATVGAMPGNAPLPGVYQLRVGSSLAAGDAQDYRSNSVPVLVSAFVNAPGTPWNPAAGVFSFTGDGFVAGKTELLLDTVPLTATGGAPAAGEFQVAGSTISFRPPAGMPN